MRIATVLLLVVVVLALPACQMNERMSGTAFGGTGGAVLGGVIAQTVGGVLLGGLAGGIVGYLIGDYLADQRERCSPCQPAPCAPEPCAPQPCAAPIYAPQPCAPATYAPQPCAPATTYYAAPRVGAVKVRDGSAEASNAWIQRGKQAATLPEAIRAYEEAVRLDPRNADGWNALGLARQVADDAAGARTAFKRALAVDPSHWAAKQNLQWLGSAGR